MNRECAERARIIVMRNWDGYDSMRVKDLNELEALFAEHEQQVREAVATEVEKSIELRAGVKRLNYAKAKIAQAIRGEDGQER